MRCATLSLPRALNLIMRTGKCKSAMLSRCDQKHCFKRLMHEYFAKTAWARQESWHVVLGTARLMASGSRHHAICYVYLRH
jgi:hypothetical protein